MESKKINQLATELTPSLSDLTIIGDPSTGISKKITLSQMASLFTGTVEEYASLAAFPLVGVADTIYIALNTNVLYRWNTGTNAYVELSPNIINSLVFNDANGFDGTISLVGSVATLTITTALTTGSVGFIGASGALLQDNANFFWDDTNNRLGLGTNAPTTAIDVFGSGIIGRLNGTSTNNAYLGFASAGSNKWSIGNVQADHRFRIYNDATTSELVSILQTGEFGIGIANPTTKLHIDGGASALIANLDANVSVAKSVSFRSDNSNRFNIEVSGTESGSNAGADLFIRRYSDAGSLIDTPLTITRSTGNATFSGILITPQVKAATSAGLSINANSGTQVADFGAGGSANMTLFGGLSGTSAVFSGGVTTGAYSYLYGLRISGNDTGNTVYAGASNMGITANSGYNIFIGQANAATTGLNISTTTGNASFSGRVTAGNTTAIADSLLVIQINAVATTGQAYFASNNAGNYGLLMGYDNANGYARIRNVSNTALTFETNNLERMRITSGGNVGINCTPTSIFSVANTACIVDITSTTSTQFNAVELKNGGGSFYIGQDNSTGGFYGSGAAYAGSIYTSGARPIVLFTNATERMRITSGGNLLINTTTDNGYKLQVNGVTQIRDTLLLTKQVGSFYAQTSSSGTTSFINTGIFYNTSIIGFSNNGTYFVSITGNPNGAGSGEYRAVYLGYIVVTTGYDFGIGNVVQRITYNQIVTGDAFNIGSLTISVVFWNGTTESNQQVNGTTSNQIRIKVTGYNSSNIGAAQDVRITKVLD